MGTRQTHYVMYGLILGKAELRELKEKDEFWLENEEIRRYEDGFQGFNLVYDGLNGGYLAFGYILQEEDEYQGLGFMCINEDFMANERLSEGAYSLITTFNRLFGQKSSDEDLHLMIFTHWS